MVTVNIACFEKYAGTMGRIYAIMTSCLSGLYKPIMLMTT